MFRSKTSKVSAVSDIGSKGSQTMHHVSCSPSKIPYIGFSPVRLQTGIQPRPSLTLAWFKREARMRHTHGNLYAAKADFSNSYSPQRACKAELYYNGCPVQRPLARLRVMLSRWVNDYYGLIRDSQTSLSLIFFVLRVFALRPRMGWLRELPQFNPRLCSIVPPSIPRRFERLHMTVPSPFALAFDFLLEVRLTHCHHRRFSGGQFNEAAKFALCCGPMDCSPFIGKDFYFRAFTFRVTS